MTKLLLPITITLYIVNIYKQIYIYIHIHIYEYEWRRMSNESIDRLINDTQRLSCVMSVNVMRKRLSIRHQFKCSQSFKVNIISLSIVDFSGNVLKAAIFTSDSLVKYMKSNIFKCSRIHQATTDEWTNRRKTIQMLLPHTIAQCSWRPLNAQTLQGTRNDSGSVSSKIYL